MNPALIRAELRPAYVHLTASEEVTGPRTCSLMEKLLVIYEKHFADMTGSTAELLLNLLVYHRLVMLIVYFLVKFVLFLKYDSI